MKTLRQLLLDEIGDRLASEIQLIGGMQEIGESASCTHLQALLLLQMQESEGRVGKLKNACRAFGQESVTSACGATLSLLAECRQTAVDFRDSPAINSALICAVRKVRHHEIASYGCMRDWAALLGYKDAAALFEELLNEGQAADKSLIELSRSRCDHEARGPQGDAGSTCDAYGHIER